MNRKVLPARTVNQMLRYLTNSYKGIPLDGQSPLYEVAKVLPDLGMDAEIVLLASNKESNYIRHVILVEDGKVKADKNDFMFSEFKDDVYTYKHVGEYYKKYYPRKKMTKASFIKESGIMNIGNKHD